MSRTESGTKGGTNGRIREPHDRGNAAFTSEGPVGAVACVSEASLGRAYLNEVA